jgi:hypothetical protein
MFARRKQEELHQAQLSAQRSHLHAQEQTIVQLQAQNEAAMLLLVFVGALALAMLIAESS